MNFERFLDASLKWAEKSLPMFQTEYSGLLPSCAPPFPPIPPSKKTSILIVTAAKLFQPFSSWYQGTFQRSCNTQLRSLHFTYVCVCLQVLHSPSCQGSVCQQSPSSELAGCAGCRGQSTGSRTTWLLASPEQCCGVPGWGSG